MWRNGDGRGLLQGLPPSTPRPVLPPRRLHPRPTRPHCSYLATPHPSLPCGVPQMRGYPLQGKLDTEELLRKSGVNFTSIRPVYIYGPLNYNPVEEWFFHRLKAGRPIPVPGSGQQVCVCVCVRVWGGL